MRLFVACSIPSGSKVEIDKYLAPIRPRYPTASWVKGETIHLTLAFIGEQPEERIDAIGKALHQHLDGATAVDAQLLSGGVFPNDRRARVAWVGIDPMERLHDLAERSRAALEAIGVEFDAKPFKPHLTVARFRDGVAMLDARQLVKELHDFESAPFRIDHVSLFSSFLSPQGAQHTERIRVPLGPSAAES